ncbi:MAG: Hsp70 family protein [Planctomycetota bacterium]
MSDAPIVGIDLGTTHSLCALFRDGRPEIVPNALGERLTPSAVGVVDQDQVIVGRAALELAVTRPEAVARCFKRAMGTDQSFELAGRRFRAPELSSLVLRSLKSDAEQLLGREVRDAVITVPAYFNDHQRQATKLAGELAGLVVRRIVNEPTAAALAYGYDDKQLEKRLLVFDLGGGTFDVTLMEVFEGALEITSTAGEGLLGGEDFTQRLAGWALRERGLNMEVAELTHPLLVARLRVECERAKRALSAEPEVRIRIPDESGHFADEAPTLSIDRASFAEQSRRLLERLEAPLARALRDGSCAPEEIDEVILVGGATRMPLVVDFVRDKLGKEPRCQHDPDEVVALGAAVQAALIASDRAVEDLVLTDVCPFTLGVKITKRIGNQLRPGYYLPIIHRNTTIPVSREESVATVSPNQREVNIGIYQGESRRVEDNLFLGELQVVGIPPGPAGQEVLIRFTYDLNGILEVEAVLPSSGERFQTVITQHVRGLSPEEVRRSLAALQQLKFYPRDELPNRQLLHFAERVVGELPSFEREGFEAALDFYEGALAGGDRELFARARDELLLTLSRLGFPFEEEGPSPERPPSPGGVPEGDG